MRPFVLLLRLGVLSSLSCCVQRFGRVVVVWLEWIYITQHDYVSE